jgi:hypothetical protein
MMARLPSPMKSLARDSQQERKREVYAAWETEKILIQAETLPGWPEIGGDSMMVGRRRVPKNFDTMIAPPYEWPQDRNTIPDNDFMNSVSAERSEDI